MDADRVQERHLYLKSNMKIGHSVRMGLIEEDHADPQSSLSPKGPSPHLPQYHSFLVSTLRLVEEL